MSKKILSAALVAASLLAAGSADARPGKNLAAMSDHRIADIALDQLEGMTDEMGLQNIREELLLRSVSRDRLGQFHVRLDQHVRGIPVYGGQVIAHMDRNGRLLSTTEDITPTAGLPSLRPSVRPYKALRLAMADFAQGTSEMPLVDLVLFEDYDGQSTLNYLVHLTDIESDYPKEHIYLINAHSGKITFDYNNLHTRAADGDGQSLYLGDVPLVTDSVGSNYEMRDPTRGGLYTTDMNDGSSGNGTIFTDADNSWGNGRQTDRASAAVDAHYGAMVTWDFYAERVGREGIRDDGEGSLSRIHYGNNYNNAYWSDSCFCMTYGDGDGNILDPLVSLDVVAHEMTHGVTSATSGLLYFAEPGGMNEGFSDIIGTAVEFYADEQGVASNPDYLIGEDIYTPGDDGDALRYMDDPTADGRSIDHASKMRFITDPHYSSGVPNNVFYLASNGGTNGTSGDSVTNPIGVEKAANIFYHAVANYMTPRSRFSQQRDATEKAAKDLYGNSEAQVMGAAWSACGVE